MADSQVRNGTSQPPPRPPRPPRPTKESAPTAAGKQPPETPSVSSHRPEPTLVLRDIHYTHGTGDFALSVPNLALYPGELTYIGGTSGCGKSTLLKLLALHRPPARGEIKILDRLLTGLSAIEQDQIRGGTITYIPQGNLGLTDNTAIDNIKRPLHDLNGFKWASASRAADAALRRVGLPEDTFGKKLTNLSGGQRARVAVALAYALERTICLADEILAPLDPSSRMHVLRLLQELAAEGRTVVVIAHEPALQQYFDRVILMRAGRISSEKPGLRKRIDDTTMIDD
jgi:ABC-type lipoprotein export system ATPase subunit